MRTLKDLDQATLQLQTVVRVLLDTAIPAQAVRQTASDLVEAAQLQAAVRTVEALASEDDDPAPEVLMDSYATVRRFLPAMLAGIALDSTPTPNWEKRVNCLR